VNVDRVIHEAWAFEPRLLEACLNIWHKLSAREYQLDHYTFDELAQLAESDDESLVSRALLYLSTPRLKVLKTCLMYEFNGNFLELPDEEVAHYSKGEVVIHPVFGEPLHESEILLCFTPGSRLLDKGPA
jgi:hypothetical protein